MAKAEYYLHGDFDKVLQSLEAEVFNSVSASLEASSDFQSPSCRCAVRVYERYSWSGGSQAVFFKINTFGEESFLDCVRDALAPFSDGN